MKWKSRHRHEDSTQSTSSRDSLVDVNDVLPQFPLPPIVVDLGSDPSPQTTPKPNPQLGALLITKDIQALLEEDDRVRAQGREAGPGNLGPIALPEDPGSVIHALPPPPRRPQRTRHYNLQSESQVPMTSGQSSGISTGREGETSVERSSTSSGAASAPSVSRPPSIKDVPAGRRTTQRPSSSDSYVMHDSSSRDETNLVNRLSDFGPKTSRSRRSTDGSDRESWISAFGFSGTKQPSNATGFPSSLADTSESMAQNTSRPLLSHASFKSKESVYSAASSIDPASTVDEPRISISSTIYPASAYNELPSPVAAPVGSDQLGSGHRDSLFYSEADSVCIEDQTQSIVDTSAAPVDCETPVPQRTAFPTHLGIYPISDNLKLISEAKIGPPPRPLSTSSDDSARRVSGRKPALPTAPKPDFRRSRSVQPPSKNPMISKPSSRSSSPKSVPYHLLTPFSPSDSNRNDSLPPTINLLNPQERTDLIRKTRKLTQVFGQTPSPMSGSEDLIDSPILNNCLLAVVPSRKTHARGAMSISEPLSVPGAIGIREKQFAAIGAGRTNSLSPIRFRNSSSYRENDSDDSLSPFDSPDAATPRSSQRKGTDTVVRSPTIISASDSFIEMADQDQDGSSLICFPSSLSFADSLTEEQRAEEERRRKREKLARLHRFLGSRVPMELVIGHTLDVPLPPPASSSKAPDTTSDGEISPASKRWLLSKRRNSLASSDPLEPERLKEELSDKEKAAAVKRALKMEKMFGEQPPQGLFHIGRTRPIQHTGAKTMSDSRIPAVSAPSSPVGGNINKSAYRKQKKRNDRPGTAESSKRLLGETESTHDVQSDIYYHYRNSLVSLTNIVDNDDKKSLVELHEYINEDLSMGSRDKGEIHSSSSIRSERRRSLPLRASYSSLASQYTISETKTETTSFEVRRRRAAKLSHFFGVSYRDLFGQVLDSLEMSVREDEGKGTLNADEAKDLLVQLTKLKARRDELS